MENTTTKYELGKNLMANSPNLTQDKIFDLKVQAQDLFINQPRTNHFMLLSNELHYYTIFEVNPLVPISVAIDKIFKFIQTDKFLVTTCGDIKEIEINEAENAIEIWLGAEYFMLFPCDDFFVKV